jgi:hypothetical protein
MRVFSCCCVLELGGLATRWTLPGAQLPLCHYTTADGLASNGVYSISYGSLLMFANAEGFSRFAGHGFANQTENTGLPYGSIRQLLIRRNGTYWPTTIDGLVRF